MITIIKLCYFKNVQANNKNSCLINMLYDRKDIILQKNIYKKKYKIIYERY